MRSLSEQLAGAGYGTGPSDFSASQAEYLGHFAGNDAFEPESSVAAFEQAVRRGGRPVTVHRYPGTKHWFFEPDRPEYGSAAASLAWDRTLKFLERASANEGPA